LTTLKVDKNIL